MKMNRDRKAILQYLYNINIREPGQFYPLASIVVSKGDKEIIERETDYLNQKKCIEKKLIETPSMAVPSCRITSSGIDVIELNGSKTRIFSTIIKKFWWIIVTLVPLVCFYLDLFGLKAIINRVINIIKSFFV